MLDNPMHSAATPEHYTPEWLIEGIRYGIGLTRDETRNWDLSGGIDLDPASCELAQTVVRAQRYYSLSERGEDGLVLPWFGSVVVNPPGSRDGRSVKAFWERAVAHAAKGEIVVFIHFSLEQLLSLSKLRIPGPGSYDIIVPTKRISYDTPGTDGVRLTDLAKELVRMAGRDPNTKAGREEAARRFPELYAAARHDGTLERVPGPNPTHGSFITVMAPEPRYIVEAVVGAVEREQGFAPIHLS